MYVVSRVLDEKVTIEVATIVEPLIMLACSRAKVGDSSSVRPALLIC